MKIREALGAQINLFPPVWIIKVCDEAQWGNLVRTFGNLKTFGNIETTTAFTWLAASRTWIQGSWVNKASREELRDTLLHEAGHIAVGPDKDKNVETQVFSEQL